ncbi:hypothetical protein Kpol_1004p30 [Vanderwaltozyma polyspora DSM 70294]|uniref:DNA repair protein RAD33 n=1 Tax=Vanderwaltozyma polyspora (strain ATCC 22028 / DSM 70294 / BCRC 21397 / CBS 2163 / NBRC 10782 / NRRL Y-8283 / UCD 57-17) TaxID=436907 RepID=A7TJ87_VANPO|nr:uncharacterized protein Kpol_1004p30 [Vanderwaltozyma polyspora DSM 70294]EDO17656.1 hypothetical protein Kpol_1004p30 [Vanderwaltozyma polyspora DSM 70294]
MSKLTYQQVEKFMKASIPQDIEDEILEAFAKYSIEKDMTKDDLNNYFDDLQLPKELYSKLRPEDLCIESTEVIDFEKLLQHTFHILIFMDNEETIDTIWKLLVTQSGREIQYPNVQLKNHILSVKDLQKLSATVGMDKSTGIVEMLSVATSGSRVYMTYIDLAYILGKLGYLSF